MPIVTKNDNAKKARRKGKKWRSSLCAAILLLSSVIGFTPSPYTSGTHDSIQRRVLDGTPDLAVQNQQVGSHVVSKAVRTTEGFSRVVQSAAISTNDLPLINFIPRLIELDHAKFPISNFADTTIKTRAPPSRLSASIL